MENKEKYSFYKQKLKKQTQSLLIISIFIPYGFSQTK